MSNKEKKMIQNYNLKKILNYSEEERIKYTSIIAFYGIKTCF